MVQQGSSGREIGDGERHAREMVMFGQKDHMTNRTDTPSTYESCCQ